jgi:Transglutaminase-like superfamily/Coenzyme PQQ synthesis protein D (PqqD)
VSLRLHRDVSAVMIDGNIVLLNERSGSYWQLNQSGSATLRFLLDGDSAAEIVRHLTNNYGMDSWDVAADLDAFLAALWTAKFGNIVTEPVVLLTPARLSFDQRLTARLAVAGARLLGTAPPHRIRQVLRLLRYGCRLATAQQAARRAVISVSVRCAGRACLQRSLATVLMCRMHGTWPTWCTGVRTSPFRAHAWVEVDGVPIGETFGPGYYTTIMTVPSPLDGWAGRIVNRLSRRRGPR